MKRERGYGRGVPTVIWLPTYVDEDGKQRVFSNTVRLREPNRETREYYAGRNIRWVAFTSTERRYR